MRFVCIFTKGWTMIRNLWEEDRDGVHVLVRTARDLEGILLHPGDEYTVRVTEDGKFRTSCKRADAEQRLARMGIGPPDGE